MKAALCQFAVSLDVGHNTGEIARQIRTASTQGARLAVFAECALSGYPYPVAEASDAYDPHAVQSGLEAIRAAARDASIWVAVGSTHPAGDGRRMNSVYVVNDSGGLEGRYDKRILFAHEREFYATGSEPMTFRIDSILFGVLVCYEMQFFELYREYRARGVQCVVHPTYSLPEYQVDPGQDVSESDSFPPSVHATYNRITILCPNQSESGGSRAFHPDGRSDLVPPGSESVHLVDIGAPTDAIRIDEDRDRLLYHLCNAKRL
jgi:predicted amidohydrolase